MERHRPDSAVNFREELVKHEAERLIRERFRLETVKSFVTGRPPPWGRSVRVSAGPDGTTLWRAERRIP